MQQMVQLVPHAIQFLYKSLGAAIQRSPDDPIIQPTLRPVDSTTCAARSGSPALDLMGAATYQRCAHSFPTRPNPSFGSCTFQVILWGSLTGLVPGPNSCQLDAAAKPGHPTPILAQACTSGYGHLGQPGSPPNPATCRPMCVVALPSLIHLKSQLTCSPAGVVTQEGSPCSSPVSLPPSPLGSYVCCWVPWTSLACLASS